LLLISTFSFAQDKTGGDRICGDEYSPYGFAGMTIRQALSFAGQIHNDYQEYLYNELSILKPDFTDENSFNNIMKEKAQNFFSQKKIFFNEKSFHSTLGLATNFDWSINGDLSENGKKLMNQTNELIKNFDEKNYSSVLKSLVTLQNEALNLEDQNEAVLVGLPITIALYSYPYWNENSQKWFDTFSSEIKDPKSPGNPGAKVPCRINLWHIGGADAGGAVGGAIDGAALGPGGALAGGVLGGAIGSSYNLVNQVIGCHVSWWPW